MKPEKGCEEMEEPVSDPREMFADVGLLIMEARLPEVSRKGRIEGPHCPPSSGVKGHVCDRHKEQCRKASDMLSQQEVLWKNRIPMRVDVLLFPNCEHGAREATVVEGATFSSAENFVLLERWDVQIVKKRTPEKSDHLVTGRFLMQAIRSYLHFSQLSSWLISRGGAVPLQIVHRVYAPGEVANYSFISEQEIHNFPTADLGDMVMRSTVTHLPRQEAIISLLCGLLTRDVDFCRARKSPLLDNGCTSAPQCEMLHVNFDRPSTSKSPVDEDTFKMFDQQSRNKMRTLTTKNQEELAVKCNQKTASSPSLISQKLVQKPPTCKRSRELSPFNEESSSISDEQLNNRLEYRSYGKKQNVRHLLPSSVSEFLALQGQSSSNDGQSSDITVKAESLNSQNRINKSRIGVKHKSAVPPSTLPFSKSVSYGVKPKKCQGQISPDKNTQFDNNLRLNSSLMVDMVTAANMLTKRLPSPKVLFTQSRKPEPSMYKKRRCLDLSTPPSSEESDSGGFSVPDSDEFSTDEFQDLVKPLSPSQLEAYLSSLSQNKPKKLEVSQLGEIPSTNCKFFLGGNSQNSDSFKVPNSSCHFLHIAAQDDSTSSLSQTTPKPRNKEETKIATRSLFRKSYSTSEVEDDLSREDYSEPTSTDKVKVNKSQGQAGVKGHDYCDNDDVFKRGASPSPPPDSHSAEKQCDKLISTCDNNTNGVEEEQQHHVNLQSQRAPRREVTLDDVSIPCRVGSVTNALTSLIYDLELMDIEEKSKSSSPNDTGACSIDERRIYDENSALLNSPQSDHDVSVTNGKTVDSSFAASKTENGCSSQTGSQAHQSGSTSAKLSLCKKLLQKEFDAKAASETLQCPSRRKNLPSPDDVRNFHCHMGRSASAMFSTTTGLPSRSSPAPVKRKSSHRFDYDCTLINVRAIKNALSCSKLTLQSENKDETIEDPKIISTSAPASTQCLLGNFEESVLNGRIEPVGVVDGFTVEIGAGGMFCPKHVTLPVAAYFFQLSDDNAPSPYLGHISLEPLGRRGYHIPRSGTMQVTLFNPNKTVVKMFVVMYDLSSMPANCQTFLRQRTIYVPVDPHSQDPSFLRYLIHLRFASSKSGKIYLHTDIRLIFARDKFEYDPRVANYELRSFTEGPENPKFSPKR